MIWCISGPHGPFFLFGGSYFLLRSKLVFCPSEGKKYTELLEEGALFGQKEKKKKKREYTCLAVFGTKLALFRKKAQLLLQLTPHQLETLSGKKLLEVSIGRDFGA